MTVEQIAFGKLFKNHSILFLFQQEAFIFERKLADTGFTLSEREWNGLELEEGN
ncbi:hypothetical protein [Sphingobacterium mizutaii]|uniref:hypothetical protein n=1 Tax=Sphingobacterium mizutaii TaxID=1010 RepID=UPI0016278586|nr:hypothetical protein [Sphingobacterium mizutaii]